MKKWILLNAANKYYNYSLGVFKTKVNPCLLFYAQQIPKYVYMGNQTYIYTSLHAWKFTLTVVYKVRELSCFLFYLIDIPCSHNDEDAETVGIHPEPTHIKLCQILNILLEIKSDFHFLKLLQTH